MKLPKFLVSKLIVVIAIIAIFVIYGYYQSRAENILFFTLGMIYILLGQQLLKRER